MFMYTLPYENSHTSLPSPEVWCEDGPCLCPGTGKIHPGGMVVQGMRGDENELPPVRSRDRKQALCLLHHKGKSI
jgi:hypothetical protein